MTEHRITPFLFEGEHTIRGIDINGLPWFVVADVCTVLGIKNPSDAIKSLDHDEVSSITLGLSEGGPDRLIVSESGLYTLILRSRDAIKPGTIAHRFRKWVTAEVIPTIRRTGQYTAPEVAPGMTDDIQMQDSLKLRKVNTVLRLFGERSGQQMWRKLDLEWVPAMASVFSQHDMFDNPVPPGSVTITVTPDRPAH